MLLELNVKLITIKILEEKYEKKTVTCGLAIILQIQHQKDDPRKKKMINLTL